MKRRTFIEGVGVALGLAIAEQTGLMEVTSPVLAADEPPQDKPDKSPQLKLRSDSNLEEIV